MKQMEITLSLACMMNMARPKARLGKIIPACSRRYRARIFSRVLFPQRKRSTHTQEMACEKMVARAAPRTPMPRAKMRMGSSTILVAAPMSTESIPTVVKPWAVMKAFIPKVSWTKMVPMA